MLRRDGARGRHRAPGRAGRRHRPPRGPDDTARAGRHARGPRAHLRGARRALEPGRPRPRTPGRRASGTASRGGARRRSTSMPIFNALAKLGAVFMPVNARLGRRRSRRRARLREAAPARRRRRRTHRSRRAGTPPPLTHDELFTGRRRRGRRRRRDAGRARRGRDRTSSSSRAAAPGARRASCSRTVPTACAASRATCRTTTASTVCMFPLFHMAGWSMALDAWQTRRPIALRDHARRADAARHRGAPPRARACTASRRCGQRVLEPDRSAATTCRRCARRHRDVGDAARAARARSRTRFPTR